MQYFLDGPGSQPIRKAKWVNVLLIRKKSIGAAKHLSDLVLNSDGSNTFSRAKFTQKTADHSFCHFICLCL